MKKAIVIGLSVAVAAVVQADIYVTFSTGFGISDGGDVTGNTPLLGAGQQALVQLIYAGADGVVNGPAGIGGAVAGDDIVISEFLSPVAVAGDFFTEFGVFAPVNVQYALVPSGVIYGRMFQDEAAAAGTFYYQGHLFTAANTVVGVPPGPPSDSYNLGQDGVALATSQVIPEPATIGLMGIAGLGMFLARRKARR